MSTTDPGNEQALRQAAEKSESQADNGDADTANGRHYFSSTMAPLLAGTFGPMASTFSICALVKNWRIYVPTDGGEEAAQNISDPPWLVKKTFSCLYFNYY